MIVVRSLTKYYGDHAAVRALDFEIASGEVVGFLGLNGAGKTTTLKLLACVLLPTSGTIRIDGVDAVEQPDEIRKRIGLLPDTPPLYNEMTVGEYLQFAAEVRGVARSDRRAFVREAEEKTSLVDKHDELIASLSHGYRQRVGVAQALIHKPALLILDEPTSGLDPVQIVEMRNLIRGLRGKHTLLISSHILAEISQTCDRLLVIHGGEIIRQGSEEEIARSLGGAARVEITLRAPCPAAVTALASVPGVRGVEVATGEATVLRVDTDDAAGERRPELVAAAVRAGAEVLAVGRSSGRLEKLFLELTAASKASGGAGKDEPAAAA